MDCTFCKEELKESFKGQGISKFKVISKGREHYSCFSCHIDNMKCHLCKGYAPHGIKLGRFSENLACEECFEKIITTKKE